MVYREVIQRVFTNPPRKQYDVVLRNMKILLASNGNCEAEIKVENEHSNSLGILHTGIIVTIVDLIPSYAIMTHPILVNKIAGIEFSGPTVSMNMSFLKGVRIGEDIIVKAGTLKTESTLAYLDCRIINKRTGEICVTGIHTKYIADLVSPR